MLPDSGSDSPLISSDIVEKYNIKLVKGHLPRVLNASEEEMNVLGYVNLRIKYFGNIASVNAIVVKDMADELLVDWKTLKDLKILPKEFPLPIKTNQTSLQLRCIEQYDDVFSEKVNPMKIPPQKILLKDGPITPFRTLTPRKIPIKYEEAAYQELDKMVIDGIIREFPDYSEWISPAVFVPKPNNGIRVCTDYTELNKSVRRPIHPFPSPLDIISSIPPDVKYFCKLDAKKGYFQIELTEESQALTCFLTPKGKYVYKRLPMGLICSSDIFCQITDQAIMGLEGVRKIVDDLLIFARTWEELEQRVDAVLKRCRKHGITLSKDKIEIGNEIKFAGFIISDQGTRPDPTKLEAIKNFPAPKNIKEVRSFMGLANQLAKWHPDFTAASTGLRQLLRKSATTNFLWLPEHEASFIKTKEILTSDAIVGHFDINKRCTLLTDASRLHGIGFALVQIDKDGKYTLIQCGSRSLSTAESNYATIELEALAIKWAICKCRTYLLGSQFTVLTDHQPLVGIFSKSDVENSRLRRLKEKVSEYDFVVQYTKGKTHYIADALSRAPVFAPDANDDRQVHIRNISVEDPLLKELLDTVTKDPEYQEFIDIFKRDIKIKNLPPDHPLRVYESCWKDISYEKGLLLYGNRILIPKSYRKKILELLHVGHAGIQRTYHLATQLYFWPDMKNHIKQMIEKCEECQKLRPSQHHESSSSGTSLYAMEQTSTDLFDYGSHKYLVMVDRFSGFPFVEKLNKTSTKDITTIMERWFLYFGYPKVIRSDNGPQFRSEFNQYCTDHGVIHETSSPYNPESNGLVEAAVKNVKYLLMKYNGNWREFNIALHEWRNIPKNNKASPSELMFGKRTRGLLPQYIPSSEPEFNVGDKVMVQDPHSKRWTQKGEILSIRENNSSFEIEINGKTYLRNKRFIKLDLTATTDNNNSNIPTSSNSSKYPRRSTRLAEKHARLMT